MTREVHWDLLIWRLDNAEARPHDFATIRRAVSRGMNRGTATFATGKTLRQLEWRLLGDRIEVRLSQGGSWSFLDPALYAVLFSHGVRGERVHWSLARPLSLPRRRVRLRAGARAAEIEIYVVDGSDED